MRVFVTVGTTKVRPRRTKIFSFDNKYFPQFDKLVSGVLSAEVQQCLASRGYTALTLQTGQCAPGLASAEAPLLEVTTYQYKPSLAQVNISSESFENHPNGRDLFIF